MKKKPTSLIPFFLCSFTVFLCVIGGWKWQQIVNKKNQLEKELSEHDKIGVSYLEKITSTSKNKSIFLSELANTLKWPIEPIKKDLDILSAPKLQNQFDFDQWELALTHVSNRIAELTVAELNNKNKNKNQNWLKNLELIDKRLEDSRQAYEDNFLKRSQVLNKYQALPWIKHQSIIQLPYSALYQSALSRKK